MNTRQTASELLPASDLLGRVVRIENWCRICGTSNLALHAVMQITSDKALVGMIGENNLSWVPLTAVILATADEMSEYTSAEQEWDRTSLVVSRPNASNLAHEPEDGHR